MSEFAEPDPTLPDDGYEEFAIATDDYSFVGVGDSQDATCLHQSIL